VNFKAKDIALLILILMTTLGFILAINANGKAAKFRGSFEKEMAFRLDMEERVTKLRSENLKLTAVLKDKDLEIQENKTTIAGLNELATTLKEDIQSLQLELKEAVALKQKLVDSLREELDKEVKRTD